jgi:TRAP-type C4-dicarboxylate transport system substrate-binding protein
MDRRNVAALFGFIFLSSLLPTPAAESSDKSISIKIATLAPEGSSWMKTFEMLNREIAEKTGNKLQLRIYAGGVLGDETDMLRKMQIGQIQAAALTSGSLSLLFKEINVLQIPFLFHNYEEVDYTLTAMDSFFKRGLEANGYVLLGWSEVGFVYLMSKTPLASVSDVRNTKVWIWEQSPMAKAIFDEAGVAAIPLSVPDVLVGLQTGLVDVVYAPPSGAISLQWFTKVKYLTDVPLAYLAGGIVVRKDTFNGMPQNFQTILLESFPRYLDQLKAVTRKENQEAIEVMVKHGMKIVSPSKDQIDEFKRLSNKAMSRLGNETFSKKALEEVYSHLETYRKRGK